MEFNQYLNPGFENTLQILRKLNYRKEKNILFMSLFQELMGYGSSPSLSKWIQWVLMFQRD